MALSDPHTNLNYPAFSVQVDPANFRLLVEQETPSPVQRWNGLLADLIAANPIGPTRASRAFALLNSGFYDLWASIDVAAKPVYAPANLSLSPDDLEQALHQFAARLLLQWFPSSGTRLEQELLAVGLPPSTVASSSPGLLAAVQQELQALPVLDPWASGSPAASPVSNREITTWRPEHVPIDDPTAPLQKYLTPAWGTLTAFATTDITKWRPAGPEPFLLVSSDLAKVSLASASLELLQDWTSPDGQLKITGSYEIRDPTNQHWMVGELINPAFVQQAQEVVDLQRNLTDEQKLIAEFWESGAGTAFPPGAWMAITSLLADRHPLSLSEQIKLFFSVGQGVGDAGIAAWDAKAAFTSARPVRVIRDLANLNLLDGDDLLNWNTYQNPGGHSSPPFPEYVSGHSTFSAAAAEVLRTYFGSDALNLNLSFEPGSSRFEAGITPQELTTLAWGSLSEAVASAGLSRLYGGIHFADGNLDGQVLGRTVGDAVLARAASLAYADLSTVLKEPFLLRNNLELRRDLPPLLDGETLPVQLDQIQLASGDDRVSLVEGVKFSGSVDGGSGLDLVSYSAFTTSVRVDLSQGQATGVGELKGFEQVVGGATEDHLRGSAADNRLEGGGGNDWLDGGPGLDTAVYQGKRGDFSFMRDRVIDIRPTTVPGHEGTDHLRSIEQITFADGAWPVADLFQPVSIYLSLVSSAIPLLVHEGQAIELEVLRQGDLLDPIQVQLAWQPQFEDRLSSDDLKLSSSGMQFILPAGQSRINLVLPTADDATFEQTKVGHLQIFSALLQESADLPVAPQLGWSASTRELVVLDNDPPPPPTAFQHLHSSPLPLRVIPGGELRVPLAYSVSDQAKDLAGLSFQVHYPATGLNFLGFTPSTKATLAADVWTAVDQAVDPITGGQHDSVRISFASYGATWPGQLGATLPLPIGNLHFEVADGFSSEDAITGLSISPVDTAHGYGFEATPPRLLLTKGWSLDVDGDGTVRPLSDGLMVMRHLMGLEGTALTHKAISPMGSRSTSASVAHWIERGRQEQWLDFDGDGRVTALGDGLMLIRAMFGMQGDALLSKALAPQSPLLEGHRYDQLSTDERFWVGEQVLDRIQTLSI